MSKTKTRRIEKKEPFVIHPVMNGDYRIGVKFNGLYPKMPHETVRNLMRTAFGPEYKGSLEQMEMIRDTLNLMTQEGRIMNIEGTWMAK